MTTIGVIGAGTMGNGIAQVFAQSGFTVKLHDAAPAAIDRARATIEKSLGKFVEKGKLTADERDGALGRLDGTPSLDAFADVLGDPLAGEVAGLDVSEDLLHRLPGGVADHSRAAGHVAVFGRVRDRVPHPGDALLVHQVDDQLPARACTSK